MKSKVLIFFLFVVTELFSQNGKIAHKGLETPVQGTRDKTGQVFLNTLLSGLKSGDTLRLKPGFYTGPATVNVANVVIDGQGEATISGMQNQSVFIIKADSVTIMNCDIIDSGDSPDRLDAGVKIREGHYVNIINNRISNCLVGIDLYKSDYCVLKYNDITSIASKSLALKGDGIRLWYSNHNALEQNYWHEVRDMVVWYSSDNSFYANKGENSRYGMHFMYSHENRISFSEFSNNSVGVFLMYSEKTLISNNLIQRNNGTSGMCVGMKETSSNQILNNRFLYSAKGIHFDISPLVPYKVNTIQGNEIAFCNEGMYFHSDIEGNEIEGNFFHDNLTQVFTNGKTANRNKFKGNYWGDYQGFDRDKDNIGDIPYVLYSYNGQLTDFNGDVGFYFGAPILEVLDFLERLAPFSKPKFILRDRKPIYKWKEKGSFEVLTKE